MREDYSLIIQIAAWEETCHNKIICRETKCLNKSGLVLNAGLGFKCSWGLNAEHQQTFA